jgi:hypothetical protein
VREAIAAGIIALYFKKGKDNPADILSKHWAYNDIKHVLQPILYWKGNTEEYGKAKNAPVKSMGNKTKLLY